MKKIVSLLLMAVCLLTAGAETYQIKVLNTPTINIDGKELKVGDSFDSSATINWSSDRQAMKVLSDKNKVYVMSGNLMAKNKVRTFSDYLTTVKSTSVRNDGENFPVTVADHRAIFENDFVLLDSISIKVGWRTNESSYFEARTTNLGENDFSFIIPSDGDMLILSREHFSGLTSNGGDITLSIKYIEKEYNDITDITDSMTVNIMPAFIE